ncbi:MAG: TIGR03905 family TSCPD domain-containing protein [Fusobacteriaceae bacterium]|nr:TIGR03905 family TSCPD domain-containing protein [Fusobacteriaceae bacterium]
MKEYFKTSGICPKEIGVDLDENGVINEVEFVGGCEGNTHGIQNLIKGEKAETISKKLKGIDCRGKGTSCPDQLSQILDKILER